MFSNYEISLIKRNDSRRYFEDVLQSYYAKNYRAAILLLYNLTIDDLYYKLLVMNDRRYYNLNQEIKTIEGLSKNALKYSEVEDKIYNIYVSKNILNYDTLDVLEFFKKVRNKCAHPSFFKEETYNPSPEEVYMIITKIYHDILIIDAFIKDPYDIVKNDIENNEWGSITDVLIGLKKHEDNYILFSRYFIDKYFDKFTDNNFEKLFNTLMKLIIIKKEEWTIINQYKNMMLMESMLEYLMNKGKIEILYDKYNWTKILEEQLVDDRDEAVYNREWFALNYMYTILDKVPKFAQEIVFQNHIIYQYMKNNVLKDEDYIAKYWHIFYDDFNEIIDNIKDRDAIFYYNIINKTKYLNKMQKKRVLVEMFKTVPTYNGFDKAELACIALINVIREEELKEKDIN